MATLTFASFSQMIDVLEVDEFFILWNHTLKTCRWRVKRHIEVLLAKTKILYVGQHSLYKGSFKLTFNSAETGRQSAGKHCKIPQ